jgi:uncharacterized protein YecE (DUF72 family)
MIKIGCCGFPVSRKRYFELFPVVEIQQTFYQPPQVSLAQKWKREAPVDFEYTMKAWQLITHEPKSPTYKRLKSNIPKAMEKQYGSFKPTEEVQAAWETTREIADALAAKVIVFQCPASFVPDQENMKNLKQFFSRIKRGAHILAWEPRGKWLPRDIEYSCRDLDLVHVVDPIASPQTYGNISYYRLHGRNGYRYKYTRDDLELLKELVQEKKDCYIMFNNMHMLEDAAAFNELVRL